MESKINTITTSDTGEIYRDVLSGIAEYAEPHDFVGTAYKLYQQNYPNSPRATNGLIFEYLICETLAQQGIVPFYYQASFKYVPDVDFDVVLYNEERPIVLTMKTSLRERYKQAVLEGLVLRQVRRRAESYLITLSKREAAIAAAKIKTGNVIGLKSCLLANQPEYTELLAELSKKTFSEAHLIMPITGKTFPASGL